MGEGCGSKFKGRDLVFDLISETKRDQPSAAGLQRIVNAKGVARFM